MTATTDVDQVDVHRHSSVELQPIWRKRDFFFERPLPEANRMAYGTNPFAEAEKIGEYLRSQTTLDDTIAVLGSEPEIYFYAHGRSATGR